MTTSAPPQATVPPHEQHDGRVMVTVAEHAVAAQAMARVMTKEWVEKHTYDSGVTSTTAHDLLDVALRAINEARCGDPEGTIVYHRNGQMARRYWSGALGKLMWLIVDPASDAPLEVDSTATLEVIDGQAWTRAYTPNWPTTVDFMAEDKE